MDEFQLILRDLQRSKKEAELQGDAIRSYYLNQINV